MFSHPVITWRHNKFECHGPIWTRALVCLLLFAGVRKPVLVSHLWSCLTHSILFLICLKAFSRRILVWFETGHLESWEKMANVTAAFVDAAKFSELDSTVKVISSNLDQAFLIFMGCLIFCKYLFWSYYLSDLRTKNPDSLYLVDRNNLWRKVAMLVEFVIYSVFQLLSFTLMLLCSHYGAKQMIRIAL